jgi:hypothetical protein
VEITARRENSKNRHKTQDKEGIKRIPIWITAATYITNNIDANESIQI